MYQRRRPVHVRPAQPKRASGSWAGLAESLLGYPSTRDCSSGVPLSGGRLASPPPRYVSAAAISRCSVVLPVRRYLATMSRGTRPHGDVFESSFEDDLYERLSPYPYPIWEYSFPSWLKTGTSRTKTIYEKLLAEYRSVYKFGNDYHCSSTTAHCYSRRRLTDQVSYHAEKAREAKVSFDSACDRAMAALNQLHALGLQTYVPPKLRNLIKEPNLLAFGSLAYLTKPAHYFSPEEFSVPAGFEALSAEDKSLDHILGVGCIDSVAAANSFLCQRLSMIARDLNDVRFYRDWRVRLGIGVRQNVPHNRLERHLHNIVAKFNQISDLMQKFKSRSSDLFKVPLELIDIAFSDPFLMSILRQECFANLHPSNVLKEKATFVLFISRLGIGLFQLYGLDPAHEDALAAAKRVVEDVNGFHEAVKLTVFYPFTNEEDGPAKFNTISEGVCISELKLFIEYFLPRPNEKDYIVGLRHRKVAAMIASETGVPCVTNKFFKVILKGVKHRLSCTLVGGALAEEKATSGGVKHHFCSTLVEGALAEEKATSGEKGTSGEKAGEKGTSGEKAGEKGTSGEKAGKKATSGEKQKRS